MPPEAIEAWANWDAGYDPKEPLTASQAGFVRQAFMSGWLARQPQSPDTSLSDALADEVREIAEDYNYSNEMVGIAVRNWFHHAAMKSKEQSNV